MSNRLSVNNTCKQELNYLHIDYRLYVCVDIEPNGHVWRSAPMVEFSVTFGGKLYSLRIPVDEENITDFFQCHQDLKVNHTERVHRD